MPNYKEKNMAEKNSKATTTTSSSSSAPVEETVVVQEVVQPNIFESKDLAKLELSMKDMLVAGVHFGHPKSRRHPKMRDYIFGTRNDINIIDLSKTVPLMESALAFLDEVRASGKKILFVGTKKQAQRFVVDVAVYTENPYVIERWLGGTLTNYENIRRRVKYMLQLGEMIDEGKLGKYTKLEQLKKREEYEKLQRRMGGIVSLEGMPGAVFVTDIKADHLAVKEAKRLGIPVVGLADSNVNPEGVDYPIPANDDALSALEYMMALVAKKLKK